MLLDQISIHSWINTNVIKTETGAVLDFKDHEYLFDIYRDTSRYLCCLKAAQIGFSTMAILKTFNLSHYKKLDIGYILPTVEMVQSFVGSKVNRMIQQNKILQDWVKDKDSISQKQIGESYIHYLGAQTQRTALMISLDMLVADEYDRSPQEILEIYDSRLQHSKFGYKWVFSNPSAPDFGVDKFYSKSDQKKWHINHSCGETFVFDESCIDYEQEMYICPTCKTEITNRQIRKGNWVATAKGEWSGYWIPLWLNPLVTAKQICDYKKGKSAEYFANMVAGLPYVGADNVVGEQTITKNITSTINEQQGTIVIGVDTGLPIHYVIGNKKGLFYHGKCKDYETLERYLERWPNSIIVSDQGGDLIGIRALQEKYPSRVFLCWFTKETKSQQLMRWGEGDESGKILADRNRLIQLVIDEFKDGRLPISGTTENKDYTKEEWKEYISHWGNIYRFKDIKDENEPSYGWRWIWKRKGPDHFALSTVYWRIGIDKYAESFAQIIGEDPMAGIPIGRIFTDD